MAEGGGDFGYDDKNLDYRIDHDDDDDDEEEVNTTQPFQPGTASTPYHGGEEMEMQTRQHEKSGGPATSYDENIPLLGDWLIPEEKQSRLDRAKDFISKRFPRVDFGKLGPIGFSKKGNEIEIVSFGPKGGKSKIFKSDASGFLKSFTDKFSEALGSGAEEIIAEDRETIQEQTED